MIKVIEIKAHPDPNFVLISYEQILPDIPGYKKKYEKVIGFRAGSINYTTRIGNTFKNVFIRILCSDVPPLFKFKGDEDELNGIKLPIYEEYWEENGNFYYYDIFQITDENDAIDFLKANYYQKINEDNFNSELNRFVTNATANSIVFYAMCYLNNQGYSPNEILELKKKLSIKNFNSGEFTQEELLSCFENQSIYFLNLYKEMNNNDRFKKFAESLVIQGTFKETFRNYTSVDHLMHFYERRVFHKYLDKCQLLYNNYEKDDKFFLNTRVFGLKSPNTAPKFYILTEDYLSKMGMRMCKECKKFDDHEQTIRRLQELENENDLPF